MSSDLPPHRYKTILLFGAPGSGKGTQGLAVGAIPRFHHFACGDAFRSLDTRSEIGQKFVEYSSRGQLVPDELTVELWRTEVDKRIAASEFKPDIDCLILDGIPRNVEQAQLMQPFIDVLAVVHLSCPNREELARRIRKRALKENRFDDASDETIQRRFQTYENESKPILEFYGPDLVHDLDASHAPVKVLSDILAAIMSAPGWQEIANQEW